ncbi:hypothetical protein GQR58_003606 [Nymphon striatum]|nr:hypothetical protein GQR58_003606 [Nymphon striatum]
MKDLPPLPSGDTDILVLASVYWGLSELNTDLIELDHAPNCTNTSTMQVTSIFNTLLIFPDLIGSLPIIMHSFLPPDLKRRFVFLNHRIILLHQGSNYILYIFSDVGKLHLMASNCKKQLPHPRFVSPYGFLDVIGEAVVTSEIGSNVLKVVDDEIRKVEAAVNEEKAKINKLGLTSNPYERPEDLIEYKSCWAVPNFPEYKPTPIRELKKLKSSNGNQHASDSVLTTPYLPQYSYSTSKNVELSYMPTPINSKKSENDDAISKSLSSYVLNSKYSDDHSKNKQKCDVDKKELLESEKTALLNDDKNSSLELESSIICEVDEKQTDTKNENNDKIDSSSHKIKISSKHKRKESSKSSSSSHSKHKTKSSVSDSSKKIEKSSDSKSKKSKHSSHNTKDEQSKDSKSDTKEKKRKHSSHHSSDNTSKKKQKLSSSDKNKSKHHSSSSSHKVNDSNNSSGKKSKESHGKDKKHSKHKKDSSSTKHSKVQSKDNKGEKKKNNNESSKSNVKENDKQSSSLTEEDGANFIKQLGKKRTAHQPSLVRENNEASLKPKISPAEVMHNRFVQLQKSSVTDHDTIMVGPYFTLHHL